MMSLQLKQTTNGATLRMVTLNFGKNKLQKQCVANDIVNTKKEPEEKVFTQPTTTKECYHGAKPYIPIVPMTKLRSHTDTVEG
ncbi:unnamed protein product [Miscanthus lutarioriparius]|uniref:Uncharacterized protein n=1 Tax=Miscanthus lutarioriparius TaxID=422564 RepID=A0A811RCS6_9POAL|nr:unnamed protein product [Miscanthus lutarioriparius]